MIQYHRHASPTPGLQLRQGQRYCCLSRSQAIPLQLRIDWDCNLILLQACCQGSAVRASAMHFRPSVRNIRIINNHERLRTHRPCPLQVLQRHPSGVLYAPGFRYGKVFRRPQLTASAASRCVSIWSTFQDLSGATFVRPSAAHRAFPRSAWFVNLPGTACVHVVTVDIFSPDKFDL